MATLGETARRAAGREVAASRGVGVTESGFMAEFGMDFRDLSGKILTERWNMKLCEASRSPLGRSFGRVAFYRGRHAKPVFHQRHDQGGCQVIGLTNSDYRD
jgi:hypothetical protein